MPTALENYGFRASHIFAQEIWSPEGGVHAVNFAAYLHSAGIRIPHVLRGATRAGVQSDRSARSLQPVLIATRGVYDDLDPFFSARRLGSGDSFDGAFQKTIAYAGTPGDELAFAFQGGAVTYLHTRAPNRGIAAIPMDGVPKGNFDLHSATIQWQSRQTFDRLGPGRHVLAIRATGESRRGSEGTFVDLDAFEVSFEVGQAIRDMSDLLSKFRIAARSTN